MYYRFSDLCGREVINVCDGALIGCVCDFSFDGCGHMIALYVAPQGKWYSLKKCKPICIPWDRIQRLGDDVVLVLCPTKEENFPK